MAAAPPVVRGYSPAAASSSSSVALSRARTPPSFVRVATRRAPSVRLRPAVADAPGGGLQLQRREAGLLGTQQEEEEEEETEVIEKIGEEKVEAWMRDSIAEIVRNIGEAPFLVHLFSGDDGVTVRREPAAPESWLDVRRRWGPGGGEHRPDGIILVEQLAAAAVDGGAGAGASSAAEAARQVWGLVVQARGMDCASCYVLDTCRVRSSAGFCTHFCLARAQCFGDPVELQLRNAWLNRLSGRR
ncbi:hypothetical protein PR202_ga13380 [Eleusine coracana subsp. coracana]|uniref:DUF7804 domain-containing protein n=1 Tax=Eleusine coracana subsp. coracana TaxID=191504 RepID=A0AAV5CEI8_ELECO|nr:hypothetical protein QOZ80_3BG0262440 [Eleusine coracana subsp. coracana]GJM96537.1 hypothetical protein PR202_ga13380 [Eleusine coracana subsp. coracana]